MTSPAVPKDLKTWHRNIGDISLSPWARSMALADTGYWLALANKRDRWHDAALAAARSLDQPLVVTWPVLVETCHALVSRLGVNAEVLFLREVSRSVTVHELNPQRLPEICAYAVGAFTARLRVYNYT